MSLHRLLPAQGTALIASLLFLGALVAGTPAQAQTVLSSADNIQVAEPVSAENQQILDFFNTYGVQPEVQEELLLKLQNGEIWDSLGGVAPISEKQLPSGEILSTFPDGSIAVFSYFDGQQATLPSASLGRLVSPQSVSDCAFSGSHYAMYWKNCKAVWSYGYANFTLRFNYEHTQGGWRISHYWEDMFRSYNGNVSNTRVIRYSDTHVTYYADYKANNGGSHRVKNDLKVHKSTAWTEKG
ncbi:hypothetical protein [Rothia nasimurium]|uniref:hypothetical protein n=1 Tax=Rothia nasimurium TaxID=85336 RepID=UPI003BA14E3A